MTLPPFELRPLVDSIFSTPQHSPSLSSPPPPLPKAPTARSVDAIGSHVWVGTSDGDARVFELKPRADKRHSVAAASDVASSPRSPGSATSWKGKEREHDGVEAVCVEARRVVGDGATQGNKPRAVEKLVLVPKVAKAIILSEGALTIHSLPTLDALPTNAFTPVRGVSTFALDEDDLASAPSSGVTLCAVKKKTILVLRIFDKHMVPLRELPLPSGAFQAVLRSRALLLADVDQYSVVNIKEASVVPLMPISQSSDPNGKPNPRHRPSMISLPNKTQIGGAEFLFACHTGSTALGIFVDSSGLPSRSTLTWPANPRALTVSPDGQYVIALLGNGTIEIHDLEAASGEGELVQTLEVSDGMDPRGLIGVTSGVAVPASRGESKLRNVNVNLYTSSFWTSQDSTFPVDARCVTPSTPPTSFHTRSSSIRTPTSLSQTDSTPDSSSTLSHVLLLGKSSVYALVPLTLLSRAESLLAAGQMARACQLASSAAFDSRSPSVRYVLQKCAMLYMREVKWTEAADAWYKGSGDPRVWIRLLGKSVRAGYVVGKRDDVEVAKGLEPYIRDERTADALISSNLARNYSPHIQPSVDSAPSTVQLKTQFTKQFVDATLDYLKRWKHSRLISGGAQDESRKVDMVVDTAVAELYAVSGHVVDLKELLDAPNDVALAELEPALKRHERFHLLVDVQLKRGSVEDALYTLSKLLGNQWHDPLFNHDEGLDRFAKHLVDSPVELLLEHITWLAKVSPPHANQVLRASKSASALDPKSTFTLLLESNEEVAEVFGQRRAWAGGNECSQLTNLLVQRWIGQLKELSKDKVVAEALRALVDQYIGRDEESKSDTFFIHVLNEVVNNSAEGLVSVLRLRLKVILFLARPCVEQGASLAEMRRLLEGMGGREDVFAYERALVYGKLGLHRQAVALLAITLKDLSSAELYCLHSNSFTLRAQAIKAASTLGLSTKKHFFKQKTNPPGLQAELLGSLVQVCLSSGVNVAAVLDRHAVHLPPSKLLPEIPESWPLEEGVVTWIVRGLRRSRHARDEGNVLKMMASGLEQGCEVRLGGERASRSKVLQTEGPLLFASEEGVALQDKHGPSSVKEVEEKPQVVAISDRL